jgi:hypothetical protein
MIPRAVRKAAGVAAGVRLVVQMREDEIIEVSPSRRTETIDVNT